MVAGNKRSRTFRRKKVRTPGAKTITVYTRRKPSKAICGSCGATLKGVVHNVNIRMKNVSKSSKRPARAFSNLCSSCSRRAVMAKARQ